MSERAEIESWVTEQFAELADFGFSKPVISHDSWSTVIDWVGTEIALELELDWREFDAFFLLVKVEGGQLPQGYYVSNGTPPVGTTCRQLPRRELGRWIKLQ